jgi:hypothetical protein
MSTLNVPPTIHLSHHIPCASLIRSKESWHTATLHADALESLLTLVSLVTRIGLVHSPDYPDMVLSNVLVHPLQRRVSAMLTRVESVGLYVTYFYMRPEHSASCVPFTRYSSPLVESHPLADSSRLVSSRMRFLKSGGSISKQTQ